MQGLKEKKSADEAFRSYLKHFSFQFEKWSVARKAPPDYLVHTAYGKILAMVSDYDSSAEILEKLQSGKKKRKGYKRLALPSVLVLHKGGLPGLEHRFIQHALQKKLYPQISAVALLEGKPGQERLRIFHNRFSKYPLDRRVFDRDKDKNFFLADLLRKDFFWIAEEAL